MSPGAMGAAVGRQLTEKGVTVLWASSGRSEATIARAAASGLHDAGTAPELVGQCEVLLSICPPADARAVAESVAGFKGIYVEANAISPATTLELEAIVGAQDERFVDGGIIGPPPDQAGTTRLYLSGPRASEVADLFDSTGLEAVPLDTDVGSASALKMAYAAWAKGSLALVLAAATAGQRLGVGTALEHEWSRSQPEISVTLTKARRNAHEKGWRWEAEMHEIARTMRDVGLPHGFHEAAADVFRAPPSS